MTFQDLPADKIRSKAGNPLVTCSNPIIGFFLPTYP